MGISWWRTVITLGIFLGLIIFGLQVVVAGYNQFLLPPDPLHLGQAAKAFEEYFQESGFDRHMNSIKELIVTYQEKLRALCTHEWGVLFTISN
ncbi:hypothetical protein SAMN02745219_00089 [Desulfofundulus thermosubterraneus DSM 16057]|uniref:Uncharacterized protein n=2 Tax=Desulfofundulus TaxID=2282741 RepID=A0A1M6ABS4_9FIRM|nr:hypothetical protein SAMN02745219_00089 [Desulfofundulus thermosubterraneus DSM 16057]